jgi:hypothetical protein
MDSDKFAEKFKQGLGQPFRDEIVDASKNTDEAIEERNAIREIINTELLWKNQDEGFIGALQWVLRRLDERDKKTD